MDILLDEAEARVLGSLLEKEMTTPEYYPMSLNALTNACNQKSNRNPVTAYDETAAEQAVERLQQKGLARSTQTAGSRVKKYMHTLLDRFDLSSQEMSVICELMLRGPQTSGELRSRCERMSSFGRLDEVEQILRGLAEHDPPLARRLPREPGRKEPRYMHLLSGETPAEGAKPGHGAETPHEAERLARLEDDVVRLGRELEELKKAFAEFRSQF